VETLLNPQTAEGRSVDSLKGLCAGRAKKLWGRWSGRAERVLEMGWVVVVTLGWVET